MALIKCPECGTELTSEMIEANMCWECGKILDESLLDKQTLENIRNQAKQNQSEQYLQPNVVDEKMKKLMKTHMVTTGYNFDGYKITKYIDIIQSEIVLGTGFLSEISATVTDTLGISSSTMSNKLSEAKREVQYTLIRKSIKSGANATIGIDFDITTLRNNILVVSATGTAVVIEQEI